MSLSDFQASSLSRGGVWHGIAGVRLPLWVDCKGQGERAGRLCRVIVADWNSEGFPVILPVSLDFICGRLTIILMIKYSRYVLRVDDLVNIASF